MKGVSPDVSIMGVVGFI